MVVSDNELPSASGTVAKAVICKIHNMTWLKHNDTSTCLNSYKNYEDTMLTALPQKKKGAAELPDKKKKTKKRKPKKSVNNNTKVIDVALKSSDSSRECKGAESIDGTVITKESQQPVPNVSTSEQQSDFTSNVWTSESSVVQSLFPDADSNVNDGLNEEEALAKAMAESICTAMAEGCRIEESYDKTVEKTDDKIAETPEIDETWGKITPNLPKPESNEEECQKSDANNNAGSRKIVKTSCPSKKFDETVKYGKSENAVNAVGAKSLVTSDEGPLIPEIEAKFVDKFNRPDGCTEKHFFMGRGALRKESQFLQQQQRQKGSNGPFQYVRNESRSQGTNDRLPQTSRRSCDSNFDRTSNRNTYRPGNETHNRYYNDNNNKRQSMGHFSRHNNYQTSNDRPYNNSIRTYVPGRSEPQNFTKDNNCTSVPAKSESKNRPIDSEIKKAPTESIEICVKGNNEADFQDVTKELLNKDLVDPKVCNLKITDFNSRHHWSPDNAPNTSITVAPITGSTTAVSSAAITSAIGHVSSNSDNVFRQEEIVSSTVNASSMTIEQSEMNDVTLTKPMAVIPLETLYANLRIHDPLLHKLLLHNQERIPYSSRNIVETGITTIPEISMIPEVAINPTLEECSSSDNTFVQHTQKLNPNAKCYESIVQQNWNSESQYLSNDYSANMGSFTQATDNYSHVPCENSTSNLRSMNPFHSDMPASSSHQGIQNIKPMPYVPYHQNYPFHGTQRPLNYHLIAAECSTYLDNYERMILKDPIPNPVHQPQMYCSVPTNNPQIPNSRQHPPSNTILHPIVHSVNAPFYEAHGSGNNNMVSGYVKSDYNNYVGGVAGSSTEYYNITDPHLRTSYFSRHPPGFPNRKSMGDHRGRGRSRETS